MTISSEMRQRLLEALRGAACVWHIEGCRHAENAQKETEVAARVLRGLAEEYRKTEAECEALVDELERLGT